MWLAFTVFYWIYASKIPKTDFINSQLKGSYIGTMLQYPYELRGKYTNPKKIICGKLMQTQKISQHNAMSYFSYLLYGSGIDFDQLKTL